MSEVLLVWLFTLLVHSSAFLLLAWLLDRGGLLRDNQIRECMWRIALFAGFATASVHAWTVGDVVALAVPAASERGAQVDDASSKRASSPPPENAVLPAEASVPVAAKRSAPAKETVPRSPQAASASSRAAKAGNILWMPRQLRALGNAIAASWLALAVFGLMITVRARRRLLEHFARLPGATDSELLRVVARLSGVAGIHPPQVKLSRQWGSPLVARRDLLSVPEWTLTELNHAQRRAMLAHEIAHLRRRDPAWRLLVELVRRVLWFQPLALLAARRLEEIAELRCDAWAADATQGRALAESLARCAEHLRRPMAPQLAVAMAGPHSPLVDRVRRLLEEKPMRPIYRVLTASACALAVAAAVAVLPGVAFQAQAAGRSISIETGSSWLSGSHLYAEFDHAGGRIKTKIKGDLRFSDNEDDIAKVGNEGWIEEIRAGVTRRFEFAAGKSEISRRYLVDGTEKPFDEQARKWLAGVVPVLMRETGIQVEDRVARILARGGASAVLDEIQLIEGAYARRIYVQQLSSSSVLEPAALTRAIGLVAAIDSDFERRSAFEVLIQEQTLGAEQQAAVLQAVATMDSDFEQRTVMALIEPKLILGEPVRTAWLTAVKQIESDFERRQAISALADRADLDASVIAAAMEAIDAIGSDFEHRSALEPFAARAAKLPELAVRYAQSAQKIGSDFERRSALVSLVEGGKLDTAGYSAVLNATDSMGSDFEQRNVLVEVAQRMPADAELIKRYRQIARKMGDFERGQAERALDRFAEI